jgi:hypothetical protein
MSGADPGAFSTTKTDKFPPFTRKTDKVLPTYDKKQNIIKMDFSILNRLILFFFGLLHRNGIVHRH